MVNLGGSFALGQLHPGITWNGKQIDGLTFHIHKGQHNRIRTAGGLGPLCFIWAARPGWRLIVGLLAELVINGKIC